jgi:hypothetical protein
VGYRRTADDVDGEIGGDDEEEGLSRLALLAVAMMMVLC